MASAVITTFFSPNETFNSIEECHHQKIALRQTMSEEFEILRGQIKDRTISNQDVSNFMASIAISLMNLSEKIRNSNTFTLEQKKIETDELDEHTSAILKISQRVLDDN